MILHRSASANLSDTTASSATEGDSLLRVDSVSKAFGPTQALRDCTFCLRAGEIKAIVGENGSGKSTLVKILSGIYGPDRGTIAFGPRSVSKFPSPRAAKMAGIATVFQEILVSEARSVLDNVWLGHENLLRSSVSRAEKRKRAAEMLTELLDMELPLGTAVEDLSLSDRQSVSIVRALLQNPRILILDEATSALDIATRDRLFAIVRRLSREGVGTVVISHRMDEIEEISDSVAVFRSGTDVGTLARGEWDSSDLVRLMTGSRSGKFSEAVQGQSTDQEESDKRTVLSVRQLRLRADGKPFDLEIRAGELVGLAGLEGQGQARFLRALWGVSKADGVVMRHTDEGDKAIRSSLEAAAQAVAYVPRERGLDSIFGWMSIRENFALPTLKQDCVWGFLRPGRSRKRLDRYVDQLGIVLGSPEDRITSLSGGNQQKVIIARWLAADPQVLLLHDPTRGVDIQTKRQLYKMLRRLSEQGVAVVMLSTEVDELVELMDRVLVFHEHELFAEMDHATMTRESLVESFFGGERGEGTDDNARD